MQRSTKCRRRRRSTIIKGKNNKKRLIVIPAKLAKEIKSYSKIIKKILFRIQKTTTQTISLRSIQYRFKKPSTLIDQEENTNIYSENLKPHDLRHSFAIHALKTNPIKLRKRIPRTQKHSNHADIHKPKRTRSNRKIQ